ncbi:hypothetical protein [Singulisphaera sp. PoT]|uniref:hypothetical protein n=1 Tax=Singulisphaera sp. PoT TaxID=3411797 RepID=UPI003BF5E748
MRLDRESLSSSSSEGATIKPADLIDNVSSVVGHDLAFATIDSREKQTLQDVHRHGPADPWARAREVLCQAQEDSARLEMK